MEDCKSRALIVLELLELAEPRHNDQHLAIASRIAFPLEALESVQNTPRFHASFAIEVLRRAIASREPKVSLVGRYEHALATTKRWVASFA